MVRVKVNLIGSVDNRTQLRMVVDGKVRLYNTQIRQSRYISAPNEPGLHSFALFETDFIFGEYKTRNVENFNVRLDSNSTLTINIYVDTTFGVKKVTYSVDSSKEYEDNTGSSYVSHSSYSGGTYSKNRSKKSSKFKDFAEKLWESAEFILKIFVGVILVLLLITLLGMGCEHFQLL